MSFYLCGDCRTITHEGDWTHWNYHEDEGLQAAPEGEPGQVSICPTCGFRHTDDDAGPGLWGGTREEMEREQ